MTSTSFSLLSWLESSNERDILSGCFKKYFQWGWGSCNGCWCKIKGTLETSWQHIKTTQFLLTRAKIFRSKVREMNRRVWITYDNFSSIWKVTLGFTWIEAMCCDEACFLAGIRLPIWKTNRKLYSNLEYWMTEIGESSANAFNRGVEDQNRDTP